MVAVALVMMDAKVGAKKVVTMVAEPLVMVHAPVAVLRVPMRDVKLFKKEQLWKQRCYLNI